VVDGVNRKSQIKNYKSSIRNPLKYLGNMAAGQTVNYLFNTNDSDGAPAAPTTAGTVSVYKDNDTTPTTAGVTYTPSFNSIVGVNLVSIVTSDAFYAAEHDYTVVLSGAVIDGETVSATVGMFSLGYRTSDVTNANQIADAVLARDVANAEASAPQTSLGTVILATANKANTTDNPGYLTIYRTDGTTEHSQIPVSTSHDADPIDGVG
jgi:hypothetical protein